MFACSVWPKKVIFLPVRRFLAGAALARLVAARARAFRRMLRRFGALSPRCATTIVAASAIAGRRCIAASNRWLVSTASASKTHPLVVEDAQQTIVLPVSKRASDAFAASFTHFRRFRMEHESTKIFRKMRSLTASTRTRERFTNSCDAAHANRRISKCSARAFKRATAARRTNGFRTRKRSRARRTSRLRFVSSGYQLAKRHASASTRKIGPSGFLSVSKKIF